MALNFSVEDSASLDSAVLKPAETPSLTQPLAPQLWTAREEYERDDLEARKHGYAHGADGSLSVKISC